MRTDEKIGWTNADATLAFFDKYEKLKSENKALKEELEKSRIHWATKYALEKQKYLKLKTKKKKSK